MLIKGQRLIISVIRLQLFICVCVCVCCCYSHVRSYLHQFCTQQAAVLVTLLTWILYVPISNLDLFQWHFLHMCRPHRKVSTPTKLCHKITTLLYHISAIPGILGPSVALVGTPLNSRYATSLVPGYSLVFLRFFGPTLR